MSLCSKTLLALDQPPSTLSVAFIGLRRMRALNRRYRGKDYATDVLSFAYAEVEEDGMPFLGEIVISPDVAARNALRLNSSTDREIGRLLVHGILHLMGYNHETDNGEMIRLQRRLVRRSFFLAAGRVLGLG